MTSYFLGAEQGNSNTRGSYGFGPSIGFVRYQATKHPVSGAWILTRLESEQPLSDVEQWDVQNEIEEWLNEESEPLGDKWARWTDDAADAHNEDRENS